MRTGTMTPGDYATLTEEMEHLGTQDYMGAKSWRGINDEEEEGYRFPLVMKPRHRSDSMSSALSGAATPSGGRKLSEKDLAVADAALSSMHLNGNQNGH